MSDLEAELVAARELSIRELADAVEAIGFECTRCGACCRGDPDDPHTATVFPDEVRDLAGDDADWRDVARPMPFGLENGTGETFEWALATDDCGNCTFYNAGQPEEDGVCTAYADRPLICETYPFSVDVTGSAPMGAVVDRIGPVRVHECEGLGRNISRADAEALTAALKRRTVRELEEAIDLRDRYERVDRGHDEIVVHDSEGAKHPDGTAIDR